MNRKQYQSRFVLIRVPSSQSDHPFMSPTYSIIKSSLLDFEDLSNVRDAHYTQTRLQPRSDHSSFETEQDILMKDPNLNASKTQPQFTPTGMRHKPSCLALSISLGPDPFFNSFQFVKERPHLFRSFDTAISCR